MDESVAQRRAGRHPPEFTIDVTYRARARLKTGTVGGADLVVSEVLLGLSANSVEIVHKLFLTALWPNKFSLASLRGP